MSFIYFGRSINQITVSKRVLSFFLMLVRSLAHKLSDRITETDFDQNYISSTSKFVVYFEGKFYPISYIIYLSMLINKIVIYGDEGNPHAIHWAPLCGRLVCIMMRRCHPALVIFLKRISYTSVGHLYLYGNTKKTCLRILHKLA